MSRSAAFAKGGCGCLLLFAVLGLAAVALHGRVHVSVLGLLALFVVGGLIALIGYREKEGETAPPTAPPSGWYWTCLRCGRMNSPSTSDCARCSAPKA